MLAPIAVFCHVSLHLEKTSANYCIHSATHVEAHALDKLWRTTNRSSSLNPAMQITAGTIIETTTLDRSWRNLRIPKSKSVGQLGLCDIQIYAFRRYGHPACRFGRSGGGLEKRDGKWRILHWHSSAPRRAPTPQPSPSPKG